MDLAEVLKLKELRGNIIEILYKRYGDTITINTLKSLLRYKGYIGDKDVHNALTYLTDESKKFVKVKINDEEYDNSLISLLGNGVNLAEGDITDLGVTINE